MHHERVSPWPVTALSRRPTVPQTDQAITAGGAPARLLGMHCRQGAACRRGRHGTRPGSVPITVSDWQAGAVEISAAGRGGRAGQRGRYGVDGGFAGLAVFGVIGARLASTVAWAVRRRRLAVAALAAVGGAVEAGSAASYLYSGRAGHARDLGAAAG